MDETLSKAVYYGPERFHRYLLIPSSESILRTDGEASGLHLKSCGGWPAVYG